MMWKVRAVLEDRPGAMAALAVGCGNRSVNILGVEIFPAADGRVVDELILHTPGGWAASDVAALCTDAGVNAPTVAECSPHVLEDQPVRYLRAAGVVADRPELLEDQLCQLLDAVPVQEPSTSHTMVIDDEHGPQVRLARAVPFTDTEVARATELRRLAAGPVPAEVPEQPVEPTTVVVRRGSVQDADALIAMHDRCSAETLLRRYHAPVPRVSPRLARTLLEPADGLSLVVTSGDQVVAAGLLATGPVGPELGLMVEDRWQRHGLGAKLLRRLAEEAAERGAATVVCLVQPDNKAVLSTVRRAGLRAHVSMVDGMTQYEIPVAALTGSVGRRGRRRVMGEITTPLVSLLHERAELREIYPPADFIDRAVRDGA
jgi:GNAT superfamily N-acetyltransferase